MFEKAFVINLDFKKDRLTSFQSRVPKIFQPVQVWPAVHGDSIQHPGWWRAGRGAWGCYRSHMQILEYCYQNKIESYIVFEDDAIFHPDFEQMYAKFMEELPDDWQQIYLGGQLLHTDHHPPRKISDNVYFPFNVNRTHCFAVHRRGYERLYTHLNETPFHPREHIDHHSGRLHESGTWNVYCPAKWLVGQDGGPSNISGKINSPQFWPNPDGCSNINGEFSRPVPSILLDSTIDVAIELERRGWHRGHWQNESRLDIGVCNAIASANMNDGLQWWHKAVMPEAVREGKVCVCLFHPSLAKLPVEVFPFAKFHKVTAKTADEAESLLSSILIEFMEEETKARAVKPVRNLLYHVWPRKGNGVWQWNVEQLLKRIDQFDGVRSVGIVTSPDSDSVEAVKAAFAGVRIDNWVEATNNPNLGEVVTFKKLLETLPQGNGSVTFYAHAKGVKYNNPEETRFWTEVMYETCLDDMEYTEESLRQFPICGSFLKNDKSWSDGPANGWHFSGSFFWFRNNDVFSKPSWSNIKNFYWGTEVWPGSLFTKEEAGSLFGEECGRLYNQDEIQRIKERLDEWRSRNRMVRTQGK